MEIERELTDDELILRMKEWVVSGYRVLALEGFTTEDVAIGLSKGCNIFEAAKASDYEAVFVYNLGTKPCEALASYFRNGRLWCFAESSYTQGL